MNPLSPIPWRIIPRDYASATKCAHLSIKRQIPVGQQAVESPIVGSTGKPVIINTLMGIPMSMFTCASRPHLEAVVEGANVDLDVAQQVLRLGEMMVNVDICRLCPYWQDQAQVKRAIEQAKQAEQDARASERATSKVTVMGSDE